MDASEREQAARAIALAALEHYQQSGGEKADDASSYLGGSLEDLIFGLETFAAPEAHDGQVARDALSQIVGLVNPLDIGRSREIQELLSGRPGLTASQIGAELKIKPNYVRGRLKRLLEGHRIDRRPDGAYVVTGHSQSDLP